jgi:serine/threonine protein kinase
LQRVHDDTTQRTVSGSFGSVTPVIDRQGRVMACKEQAWNRVSRNEYTVHRYLQPRGPNEAHANIVRLVETRMSSSTGTRKRSYLLFELADMDLLRFLRRYGNDWQRFPVGARMVMLHDMVRGLRFLHRQRVLHLDLKPANILIFGGGRCKVGDLGAAYIIPAGTHARTFRDMQTCVVTNPYRAPELMFATAEARAQHTSLTVTQAADVWALGAIVLDLFNMSAFQTSTFVRDTRAAHSPSTLLHPQQAELIADTLQSRLVDEWLTPIPTTTTNPNPDTAPILISPLKRLVSSHPHLPTRLAPLVLAMLARAPQDRPTMEAIAETLWCSE